jgi:hypothetical protein
MTIWIRPRYSLEEGKALTKILTEILGDSYFLKDLSDDEIHHLRVYYKRLRDAVEFETAKQLLLSQKDKRTKEQKEMDDYYEKANAAMQQLKASGTLDQPEPPQE